jgi:hypothetical protein
VPEIKRTVKTFLVGTYLVVLYMLVRPGRPDLSGVRKLQAGYRDFIENEKEVWRILHG